MSETDEKAGVGLSEKAGCMREEEEEASAEASSKQPQEKEQMPREPILDPNMLCNRIRVCEHLSIVGFFAKF